MAITINGSGTVTGLSVGGLPDGTVDSGTLATDSVTAVKIPDTVESSLKSGRKNLIINGGFDVWQRGTSFSPTGSRMYTADRWSFEGASLTISRSTDVPSGHLFKYSARIQNTSGATSNNRSYIEDLNTLLPNGIPWTLSAWVKVTSGGINLDLGDTDVVSGGFSTSSVWTKISVSSSSRNTAGVNAFLDIFVDANTDAYITGIQLELGSVATDFEHRSYGEELALCQRYFWATAFLNTGVYNTDTSVFCTLNAPVTFRTAPTVSMKSGTYTNINIEKEDAYDISNVAFGYGTTQAYYLANPVLILTTPIRTGFAGQAGMVSCDRNDDAFFFEAEL